MVYFYISTIQDCFEIKQDNETENKQKANRWHKKNKLQLNSGIITINELIYRALF